MMADIRAGRRSRTADEMGQGPGRAGGDHTRGGTPAATWPAEHDVAAAEVGAPDIAYESLVSLSCCRQGYVCCIELARHFLVRAAEAKGTVWVAQQRPRRDGCARWRVSGWGGG
jgi:hypothetical protein